MRERATSVGGTVEAGPLAASGFRVAARLPAPGTSRSTGPANAQDARGSGGTAVPGGDRCAWGDRRGWEREVLGLVAAGLSNEEIARRLCLSPLTAKTHVSRILTKLSARDRAQLVVVAYETGLVTPGQQAHLP